MAKIGGKLEQRLSAWTGYINPSTVSIIITHVHTPQVKGGDHMDPMNPKRSVRESAKTALCKITLSI